MPLLQSYVNGRLTVNVHDAYLDRLSKPSDIQDYLEILYDTARSYPQVRVLELGTRKGNSTLAFLAAAQQAGGHVWSGDIENVLLDEKGMGPWKGIPGWTFIQGDSLDPEMQGRFPGEVDVFFLDTSHRYEDTLAECRAYVPRVRKGGIALFHDTQLMGLAGEKNWGGHPPRDDIPEVAQALDAYCGETGLIWANITGNCGLGIIRL